MGLLESAIGLLAPTTCLACGREGSVLCELCVSAEIIAYGDHCWRCSAVSSGARTCIKCRHVGGPRYVWVSTIYENAAARLVRIYKYGHLRAAAAALADIMAQTFVDHQAVTADDYIVVPVPTATRRLRQRGFDHGDLLATKIAQKLGRPKIQTLGRLGQARQVGAPRAQRLHQPQGQYWLRTPELTAGRSILLVDDVVTTGATLAEIARVLRAGGARRVDALVFAKRL